jgi:outer membrane protein assembly factor BamB
MKVRRKIALAVSAIVSVFIAALVIWISQVDTDGVQKHTKKTEQRYTIVEDGTNWPMFRGSQELSAVTFSNLPDSMILAWKFKTAGEVKSSPSIYNGTVFVGSNDANLYAIDLKSGTKKWSYRTDDNVEAGPCVVDGMAVIGSLDTHVYALDAETGSLKWNYKTDGQIMAGVNWTQMADGQRTAVLVGSYDSKLYCLNLSDGKCIWTYETDNYINGSCAISENKAIFGGCDGMVHAVSLSDGSEVAAIEAGSYIAASAGIFGTQAYIGSYEGVFLCVDITTKEILWKYEYGDAPFFSSPAVDKDFVVFGSRDNKLRCLRRGSGEEVWAFKTGGVVDSSPVICGDKVVFGSEDGRLYFVRLSDGSEVWSFEIGAPVMSSPAVANGMLVVGSDDGYVYAFGGSG